MRTKSGRPKRAGRQRSKPDAKSTDDFVLREGVLQSMDHPFQSQAAQDPAAQGPDNTILIVDDDAVNRKILGRIFSPYYAVEEAPDGCVGLEKILSSPGRFCAVLLDVLMPGLSGIEVLSRLRERKLPDALPIFLITAEQSTGMVQEAYALGVMDVLYKPVIPYVVLRRVRSVIELFEARKHLSRVAGQQSLALQRQSEQIAQLNQGMLEAMATAIEFRGEEYGGHVQRVRSITRILLKDTDFAADIPEKEIENIALAAILHDVGKISIPDTVLCKPGKLTPDERKIMEEHTLKGAAILESIPHLRRSGIYEYACDIVRHHHERWDGKGYPDGLAGDEISPWAQVVSLADVYDALSCQRVYKPPFPRELVLKTILTGQCGTFNPRLLDCFLSVEDQLYELYRDLPKPGIG